MQSRAISRSRGTVHRCDRTKTVQSIVRMLLAGIHGFVEYGSVEASLKDAVEAVTRASVVSATCSMPMWRTQASRSSAPNSRSDRNSAGGADSRSSRASTLQQGNRQDTKGPGEHRQISRLQPPQPEAGRSRQRVRPTERSTRCGINYWGGPRMSLELAGPDCSIGIAVIRISRGTCYRGGAEDYRGCQPPPLAATAAA